MAEDTATDLVLLHALADHELDAAAALALERRIATDAPLAAEYETILAVKNAMGRLERPAVSDAFAARIAVLTQTRPVAAAKPIAPRRFVWTSDWRALAASFVVTACLASGLTYAIVAPVGEASLEAEIAGGHRRSLLAASPIDIASSDRHTVRPWFDGKLGLSPPTPDLAAAGFPLVGGRVEVVGGQPVPSLVYRHKEHLISVVALPTPLDDTTALRPVASVTGSYNVVRWTQSGFRYFAVSDLDAAELGTFAEDMRAHS